MVVATVIPTVTLPVEAAADMARTAVVLLVAPTARAPMVPVEQAVIRCPTWVPV
jgi:hypothetical protein